MEDNLPPPPPPAPVSTIPSAVTPPTSTPPPPPAKPLHPLLLAGGAVLVFGLGIIIGLFAPRFLSPPLPTPTPATSQYVCPQNGWVNCMPILTEGAQRACTNEAIAWYRQNCPNFQGVAQ